MTALFTGPCPVACSNTPTVRWYHPKGEVAFLANLAYISVPHRLPPSGSERCEASEACSEFTRLPQSMHFVPFWGLGTMGGGGGGVWFSLFRSVPFQGGRITVAPFRAVPCT